MTYRWLAALLLVALLGLPVAAQETSPGVTIHVVQRGENLFRIALQYGLSIDELAQLNSIADLGNIQVGQRLLVPTMSAAAVADQPQSHVVQPGETLRSIAELYGVSLEELAAANQITDVNLLYVGQVLNVSAALATEVQTVASSAVAAASVEPLPAQIHLVQPGETLFRIASNYGVTVNDLARANSISDPTVIYVGQQLVIAGDQPSPLALDLPSIVTGLDVTPLALVEGQSGRIRLTTTEPVQISGTFLNRMVWTAAEPGSTVYTILVGVPVFTEAGVYPLTLTLTDTAGQQIPLAVN